MLTELLAKELEAAVDFDDVDDAAFSLNLLRANSTNSPIVFTGSVGLTTATLWVQTGRPTHCRSFIASQPASL